MRCDIIIPVWNQLDFTKECVDAIDKNTRYPYRMIIIDNGSDAPTREYLLGLKKRFSDRFVLITNDKNMGYVIAVNQGLEASDAPYVCVFNNDTLPAPGWLENMVDFAQNHPDVGLINPQCDGHGNRSIDEHARYLGKLKGLYMEMNQCQGFCMLIKRELIDRIGRLDEAFGIGGYDDTDYSMRAHVAGYKSVAIKDAYVYHRLHASFDKAGNREEWVRRNQAIYYKKWGKHLRMAVLVSMKRYDEAELSRVINFCYGLAREWTWPHLMINSTMEKEAMTGRVNEVLKKEHLPPHQNMRISYFRMPRELFSIMAAGKVLERLRARMRDKRFDAVVSVDRSVLPAVSWASKAAGASFINISTMANVADWQRKGKETALSVKGEKRV